MAGTTERHDAAALLLARAVHERQVSAALEDLAAGLRERAAARAAIRAIRQAAASRLQEQQ